METAPTLVSPPKQGRSRLAWARILDAGEQILETEGLQGFSISAICERAEVSAAAIYARVAGKDALFLAVYERVLARMSEERDALGALSAAHLDLESSIRRAVTIISELFLGRPGFVRSIVLFSFTDEDVNRRGSEWLAQLGREFAEMIAHREEWEHREMSREADTCYRMIWSSIVMYLTYGAGWGSDRAMSKDEFVEGLCDVSISYLTRVR